MSLAAPGLTWYNSTKRGLKFDITDNARTKCACFTNACTTELSQTEYGLHMPKDLTYWGTSKLVKSNAKITVKNLITINRVYQLFTNLTNRKYIWWCLSLSNTIWRTNWTRKFQESLQKFNGETSIYYLTGSVPFQLRSNGVDHIQTNSRFVVVETIYSK